MDKPIQTYDIQQRVCTSILPDSMTPKEKDEAFIVAARMMQSWLDKYCPVDYHREVRWINILDRETNPDGNIGYFQIVAYP